MIFHVLFLRPKLLEVIRNDSYSRGISQNAKGHRTPNELTLKFRVLESITVICTGRTENKLDLLSTEKNDFAFCDRTAVIHKTRYYLS